ncbi:MAG: hypothetical protein IKZ10_05000 [Akkermansia sp.]|nr:hypothetical protein [Akkermansia sp.]
METSRSVKELFLRFCLMLAGLYILAQGIAFTVIANLGTDAITSPALVTHIFSTRAGVEFFTVGRTLICIHILLVFLQIAILRSQYKPVQLLQIAMGLLLGLMLDGCMSYTSLLPVPNYAAAIGYTILACFVSAFGIFTYVKADMVPLSAEGLCLALSKRFGWNFSRVKVSVDCAMIALAVVASLILFGEVVGVREGSLICAASIGFIIGAYFRFFPYWDKLIERSRGIKTDSDTTHSA